MDGHIYQSEDEGKDFNENSKYATKCVSLLKRNALIFLVFIGVGTGFAIGFGVRQLHPSEQAIIWIGLPGELFMRMLKMTILPLVVSTIIAGTSSMNPKDNGRLGVLSLSYLIASNAIGALLGLALFYIFKPGDGVQLYKEDGVTSKSTRLQTNDMFVDMIRNLLPDNLVTACFEKTQTVYQKESLVTNINGTNITTTIYNRTVGTTGGVNILGLVIICTIVGIAAAKVGKSAEPFIQFFNAMADIIMSVLKWFIWFTPIGVASLIGASIIKVTDIIGAFSSLGMFIGCFTTGILLLHLVLIPVSYFCIMRRNPLHMMATSVRAWMTAFAPPSTAVSMPEMLNTLEHENGVDTRVSRFLVPIGASIGRIGSCMFMCLTALFLAKLERSVILITDVILIVILSTVGSLAVPSVPSSSIITIMIILTSMNVQTHNIGLLMALEWYTDRLRTTCNVASIILGGIFLNKLCKKHLDKDKPENQYTKVDGNTNGNIIESDM